MLDLLNRVAFTALAFALGTLAGMTGFWTFGRRCAEEIEIAWTFEEEDE